MAAAGVVEEGVSRTICLEKRERERRKEREGGERERCREQLILKLSTFVVMGF